MSEVICHLRHQDTCLLRQISTNTDTVAAGPVPLLRDEMIHTCRYNHQQHLPDFCKHHACFSTYLGHEPYHICYARMIFFKYLFNTYFYIQCQGGWGKKVFPFPPFGHAPRPGVSRCQNCQSCKTSGYTFNCLLHQLYTCDIKSVGISELYFLALKRWFDSDGAAQVDYSFSSVQQQRCCSN